MSNLQVVVEGSGIEAALKQLDPKNVDKALMLWYDRGTRYVQRELSNRAPGRLRGKVRIKTDGYRPPRWARVWVKSPLAHLIEGGTGPQGAPDFRHSGRHWPNLAGIMRATGLPAPQAFLVARAIGERGGNPARPFIQPTFNATQGQLVQMATDVVNEVLG